MALFCAFFLSAVPVLSVHALAVEPGPEVNIFVYKQIDGEVPSVEDTFSFELKALDGAPMPDGGAGGAKTVQLEGEGAAQFGEINYTQVGEYHYTIREIRGGNPRYTYDESVYSACVLVTWRNVVGGSMKAVLYLAKEDRTGKQAQALFINRYTMPTPVSIDPPVQKIVKGSPRRAARFSFILEAGAAPFPMPEGSADGKKTVSLIGSGQVDFGVITFIEPGVYKYTVSEVRGGAGGYSYDTMVYTMTVTVTEANGKLSQTTVITDGDGAQADKLAFLNIYKGEGMTPGKEKPDAYSSSGAGFTASSSANVTILEHGVPNTADVSGLTFWGTGLAVSALGAILTCVTAKRRKNRTRSDGKDTLV